ncbi:MAG: hypothetical protein V3U84_08430 [Thiotrichaceae bacterium]
MTAKCKWPLGNNRHIEFNIYDRNDSWNDVAGLYIFSYHTANGWHALYVGQAESFQARLPNHERLDEAVRNGATHIHALGVSQQAQRDLWEKRLIQTLQPPMNIQHRDVSYKRYS